MTPDKVDHEILYLRDQKSEYDKINFHPPTMYKSYKNYKCT